MIKHSQDRADALQKLTFTFYLSEKQANAILEMKLAKLTNLEVDKLNQELSELTATIVELKSILTDSQKVLKIIRDELEQVKIKYGNPRRTMISMELGDIDIEDLIKEEEVVISITHQDYIKRIKMEEYKAQRRGGVGITAHKAKEEKFCLKYLYNKYTLLFINVF